MVRAIVSASLVKMPAGGKVETVFTSLIHCLFVFLLVMAYLLVLSSGFKAGGRSLLPVAEPRPLNPREGEAHAEPERRKTAQQELRLQITRVLQPLLSW